MGVAEGVGGDEGSLMRGGIDIDNETGDRGLLEIKGQECHDHVWPIPAGELGSGSRSRLNFEDMRGIRTL